MKAWVVRAGRGPENEDYYRTSGRAGIGWPEIGDLAECTSKEAIREVVDGAYPADPLGRLANFTGQLWALRHSISPGDLIIMPLRSKPGYLLFGTCSAGYGYDAAQIDKNRRHHIKVNWQAEPISRSALKDDLLNTVNGAMTVFSASRNEAAKRLACVAKDGKDPGFAGVAALHSDAHAPSTDDNDAIVTDPDSKPSLDSIRDSIRTHIVENFSGHKFTHLIADVLRSMGFTCDVSAEGADGGVDILAGRGPLGLDDPTIVVEAKSESTKVGVSVVRGLHSAVTKNGAKQGLLVAWGGINKEAEKEFSQQRTTIRVWDADALIERIFEVYTTLPEGTRLSLPLRQVWVLDDGGPV